MQQELRQQCSQYVTSEFTASPDEYELQLLNLTGKDIAFLLRATSMLSKSLDTETTLKTVARLSLPHLGSWCILDLCEEDRMRRIAIIHPDPAGR